MILRWLTLLLALLSTACTSIPFLSDWDSTKPIADSGPEQVLPDAGLPWWQSFNDDVLNQIVDAVLQSNLTLDGAIARVEQARANEKIAKSSRGPSIRAIASVSEVDSPTNAGIGAQLEELGLGNGALNQFGVAIPDRLSLTTFVVGVEFNYEVDFWKRNRNRFRAVEAERLAVEQDFRTAQMQVLVQTIATYFEIIDLTQQRDLTAQLATTLQQWRQVTKERYQQGLTDARAVYAVQQGQREAEAELANIDYLLSDGKNRLWVLMGGHDEAIETQLPHQLDVAHTLESIPETVPVRLIAQREDVLAAEQRASAARFAVDAQRASFLPSLSIAGPIGLQSSQNTNLFDTDQWIRNISANLLAPIFDSGRLRGNLALAEAQLREAISHLGLTVLTATSEVSNALMGVKQMRLRADALVNGEQQIQRFVSLQEERYISGLETYPEVLAATELLIRARSARSAAQRDFAIAVLRLHRALGGAWSEDQTELAGHNRQHIGEHCSSSSISG